MPAPVASLAQVARDPEWLAHRYDPQFDAVHFVPLSRARHRSATFLTDEFVSEAGAAPLILSRREVLAAAPAPAPVHYIFHSAYCCSTLLARAMDCEGVAMGLKEPVLLNDLVGWRRRGGPPPRIAEVLDSGLRLLARPFAPGEAVVIKPSNVVNGLARGMLAMRPGARALLLHAPLEAYLGSIARKEMWGRLWVRELLLGLLKDGLVDLGFSGEDYLGLTDLQVAAVGWLAQHALFARLVAEFGEARVATLDSEALVARPGETMAALSTLFELGLSEAAVTRIAAGPAFTRHSKLDTDFGEAARHADQRDAAEVHRDEIEKVATWARITAERAGVPMVLGAPLLR